MTRRFSILLSLCVGIALSLSILFVSPFWPQFKQTEPNEVALEQIDPQHSCGAVCVAVTSRLLGYPIELNRAKESIRADGLGRTSMAELQGGLHRLGFQTIGVKLHPALLRHLGGVPTILYVDQSHYLVVLPVGDGSVVVLDPPQRVVCVSVSTLASRWNGEAIVVCNSPEELRKIMASLGISDSEKAEGG